MTVEWHRSGDEVLATLLDVVAIESVNPSLPVERTEACRGRHNLVARLEGQDPDRAVIRGHKGVVRFHVASGGRRPTAPSRGWGSTPSPAWRAW